MTPAERKLRASIAGNTRWARETDRTNATEPARRAFLNKLADQVDPAGVMPPAARARAAENAYRAHLKRMSLKAAQARRARKRNAA